MVIKLLVLHNTKNKALFVLEEREMYSSEGSEKESVKYDVENGNKEGWGCI